LQTRKTITRKFLIAIEKIKIKKIRITKTKIFSRIILIILVLQKRTFNLKKEDCELLKQ